ncbi:hypothetical protein B0H10DRAFT_2053814 [Mycena sp. CBHHK59/15]|nr:hypothetical protein B0H10DRAFT_2053814 [Mycena sp. CBHHK59/15]
MKLRRKQRNRGPCQLIDDVSNAASGHKTCVVSGNQGALDAAPIIPSWDLPFSTPWQWRLRMSKQLMMAFSRAQATTKARTHINLRTSDYHSNILHRYKNSPTTARDCRSRLHGMSPSHASDFAWVFQTLLYLDWDTRNEPYPLLYFDAMASSKHFRCLPASSATIQAPDPFDALTANAHGEQTVDRPLCGCVFCPRPSLHGHH